MCEVIIKYMLLKSQLIYNVITKYLTLYPKVHGRMVAFKRNSFDTNMQLK